MLAADRRRAFGPWLWLTMLLYFGLCMADISFYLRDRQENAMLIFQFCGSITPVFSIAPVLAALPFAAGFGNDWRSGVAVSMTLRCGRRRFLGSKFACCALAGGLALAGGMLLFVLFVNLWFDQRYAEVGPMLMEMPFCSALADWNFAGFAQFYGAFLLLLFLAGMFWAASALAVSAFLPSPSLTFCAPLVLYRLLEEAAARLPLPGWTSPCLLQTGSAGLGTWQSLGAAAGMFGLLLVACAGAFFWRAGRRLRRA